MEIVIVVVGLLLDRLTKLWAVKTLKDFNDITIIDNFFKFSYLENRGAAWGIFQNKLLFLTIITLLVLSGIVIFLVKYKPKDKMIRISFAMIIGGALGNLYDRVIYKYVVDFITLHYKDVYYFPTFNVADMCVVIGTAFLAVGLLKEGK